MIDREKLARYLDGGADPELEAQLANDPKLFEQWALQHRTDRGLRSLLGGKKDLRNSIVSAVGTRSFDQLKKEVLREVSWPDRLRAWRIGFAVGFAALAISALLVWRGNVSSPPSSRPGTVAQNAAAMQLGDVSGNVTVQNARATNGFVVHANDIIRVEAGATAALVLADKTRLQLHGGAELQVVSADGKRLNLTAGDLQASVQKQAPGQSLQIATPLAHLHVVGTTFSLSTGTRQTRLEVAEGLVRVDHAQRQSEVEVGAGEFAVAEPQSELVAGVLPAKNPTLSKEDKDFVQHPFAADSPWNQKLSRVHYAEIASGALDLRRHSAQLTSHARPLWIGKAGDAQTTISSRYTGEEFASLPVPTQLLHATGDWLTGTLIDARQAVAYELTGARRGADGIEAMLCEPINLRGSGIPPEQSGNTFSGLPAIAGVIRAGELKDGIHHALSAAALHEALNRTAGHGQPFVWPARHMPIETKKLEHMGTVGNVCYGTRLAIPRDVDVESLGLGEAGLQIARALQDYGAFVTHSFPSVPPQGDWIQPHLQFFTDEPGENIEGQQLAADLSVLSTKLKVVLP